MFFSRYMDLAEERKEITAALRKAVKVIQSCQTFDQLEVARNFSPALVRKIEFGLFRETASSVEYSLKAALVVRTNFLVEKNRLKRKLVLS